MFVLPKMLKSYKLKKLVSKTQPLMKDLVSPTKAVLYAFSDCIIQYNKNDYNLKCNDHLVLEGSNLTITNQPQGLEFILQHNYVFGFTDGVFFKFEDVENSNPQDKETFKEIQKNTKPSILETWSNKIIKSKLPGHYLWNIPKK